MVDLSTLATRQAAFQNAHTKPCKLGIAITTYNRVETLLKQINLIQRMSVSDIELVVCDDGSSDHTLEALAQQGILALGGVNRGIAWNKNRGIFYLFTYTDVDVVILLDDDALPRLHGWDAEIVHAVQSYGHINYLPKSMAHFIQGGSMTADDVGVSEIIGGMCMGISRIAFARVGFMDPRFGKYGHEHSDYSRRFLQAGYGGFIKDTPTGGVNYYYVIDGGIELAAVPSTGSEAQAQANLEVLAQVAKDPIYRSPWRDDAQRADFLAEFAAFNAPVVPEIAALAKSFDAELYLAANPDVKAAGMKALDHYLNFGRAENRKLTP